MTFSVRCSSCGRREAFYYRRASGEKLCFPCLEKSLMKNIRRSFSEFSSRLSVKPVLNVLILPERVVEGYVLTLLLSKVERRYGGQVAFTVPRSVFKFLIDSRYIEEGLNVITYDDEILSDKDCYTVLDSLNDSLKLIQKIRSEGQEVDAFILPYTLTDLNQALLEYLLIKRGEGSNPLNVKVVDKHPIIYPFKAVPRADVIAYVLGVKGYNTLNFIGRPYCSRYSEVKHVVYDIIAKHAELSYTMLKSLTWFSS